MTLKDIHIHGKQPLRWPHLLLLIMSSPWMCSRPESFLLQENQWQKWWHVTAFLPASLALSLALCLAALRKVSCRVVSWPGKRSVREGTEGFTLAAWEELTSAHSHVTTLDMDSPPGEPSAETTALADTWFAVWWETLRQGYPTQPHPVPSHGNSDHINISCFHHWVLMLCSNRYQIRISYFYNDLETFQHHKSSCGNFVWDPNTVSSITLKFYNKLYLI